ncbi:DUF2577 family protein [Bacillus sp. AFS017336]|uniref:DUF2577 family protein n=1 Tax=Bacillus sp. AFS017336 TaxID=2033489 RepID=UPI000BF1F68C|nr:DUF2577 family protein [Bacillus sp. AFS017336]PEL06745.1 hypothetical protein CN601_20680 [Bacillus sp. AFS017336]
MSTGGPTRLAQAIKNLGYNADVSVLVAQVISPLPDLKIKFIISKLILEYTDDDFLLCDHLNETVREIQISDNANFSAATTKYIKFKSTLNVNDYVIVLEYANGQRFIVIDKV